MLSRLTKKRVVNVEAKEVMQLSGHSTLVLQSLPLPFPFANRIITFSVDGTIRIFSTRKRECVHCLVAPQDRPMLGALAALGGDIFVTTSSRGGLIATWGAGAGEKLECLTAGQGHSVRCITSQDSSNFIAGTERGDLLFYTHSDGRDITETGRIVGAHGGCISCMSSTEKRIFSASYDKTVSVWDIATAEKVYALRHSSSAVLCVDANEYFVITGSYGKSIRLYSATDCKLITTYGNIHSGPVCSVTLLGNDHILSSSGDESLCITNLSSGLLLARIRLPFSPISANVLFDGQLVVAGHGGNAAVISPPPSVAGLLQVYATSKRPLPMQKARADTLSGITSATDACRNLTNVDFLSCITSLEEWKALHELVILSKRDNAGMNQPSNDCDGKKNWWLLTLHCLARLLTKPSEMTRETTRSTNDLTHCETRTISSTDVSTPWSEWSDESKSNSPLIMKRSEETLCYLLASKRLVEDQALIHSASETIRSLPSDLHVGPGSREDLLQGAESTYKLCISGIGKSKDDEESTTVSSVNCVNLARLFLYIVVIVSSAKGCGFLRAIDFLMRHLGRPHTDRNLSKTPSTRALPPDALLGGILVDATAMFSEHSLSGMTLKESQILNDVLSALKIDAARDLYRLFISSRDSGNPVRADEEAGASTETTSVPESPGTLNISSPKTFVDVLDDEKGRRKGGSEPHVKNTGHEVHVVGGSKSSPARRLGELEVAGITPRTISTMSREILASALAAFVLSYDQRLAHKFGPMEQCLFEVFTENDITAEVLSDEYVVPVEEFCEAVVRGLTKNPGCDCTIGCKVRIRQFYARAVLVRR